ncbi:hypothetical protein J31TS4_12610 [Paenibacillus sp. J31TS4]|uniref:L,D-transpeptidase family protein n=1 Tax=Paenibacillus sp. J31TS4 TaxID=2807195 RepID=UPI001B08AC85|nr:L,D-transpeptidase [Paenibacillus sp. J31TS4]GIP37981.1 hypothetical protein J31TS4_12610 [Paenibacillus sp. J31TS4]
MDADKPLKPSVPPGNEELGDEDWNALPDYLKRYVRQHPDSQMAWYLLGKEYARQGKTGKAMYCYARAGDVYRAFEKKAPAGPIPDWLTGEPPVPAAATAGRRKRSRTAAAALLLLLLAVLPASDGAAPGSAAGSSGPVAGQPPPEAPDSPAEREPAVRLLAARTPTAFAAAPVRLPEPGEAGALAAGVRLAEGGAWRLWGESLEPLYAVEPGGAAGSWLVRSLSREACRCEPDGAAAAEAALADWARTQEERLVVRTAYAAYAAKHGRPPETPEALTGRFPDNALSALTPGMRAAFAQEASAAGGGGAPPSSPASQAPESPAGGGAGEAAIETPAPDQPLEIIVDLAAHRLALVSGDYVLRNYPVGLGGTRTPTGTYQISEKVVEPRGKRKGEFGSRGMQLSDTDYAIHGTDKPGSIGKDESLGCVRMDQADLEELYAMVPLGTKVTMGGGRRLPEETIRGAARFALPAGESEKNPNRIYYWLN